MAHCESLDEHGYFFNLRFAGVPQAHLGGGENVFHIVVTDCFLTVLLADLVDDLGDQEINGNRVGARPLGGWKLWVAL